MAVVIDRSQQVGFGEIIDGIYDAQTFVAEGTRLNSISFFMDGKSGAPLAYRVLVTTAEFEGTDFNPGAVLFESQTLVEPIDGEMHKVTVNTGNLKLNPNQTYAFIIDAFSDRDGQESRVSMPYSHVDSAGSDYVGGFQSAILVFSSTRAEHFADEWFESGPSSSVNRDLSFVLTFSSPGVTIKGTNGNDRVDAGHAPKGEKNPTELDDQITGKGGKDRLDGLGGDDTIDGGKKKDLLTGGPGDDSFLFGVSLRQKADKITDFLSPDDTVVLKGKAFKALTPGVLSDTAFRDIGETASPTDRIVYKANGKLALDRDGNGGAKAKVFVKLEGAPDIAAADILIA